MKEQTIHLAPDKLFPNPGQPRRTFDEEKHFALTRSVKAEGILQPLRVRRQGEKYMIVVGECRWRAAKAAGLTSVPCIVEDDAITDARVRERAIVENELRSDLEGLDLAHALQAVMAEHKCTAADAAARLNLDPTRVSKSLALLKLPPEQQKLLADRRLSPSLAYELTKAETAAELEQATQLALSGATRDEVAAFVRRARKPGQAQCACKRVTAKLDADRAVTVQGSIASLDDFIATLADLLAAARKARTQGVEVGTFVKMLADKAKQPA